MKNFARNTRRHPLDTVFLGIVFAAIAFVLAIILGIVDLLWTESAISRAFYGVSFLWRNTWDPGTNVYGALPFIEGTVYSSLIALVIAVPVSFGIAIFLSELSPAWIRTPLGSVVDLLAAVPSVVFGLWGVAVLVPFMQDTGQPWLANTFHNPLLARPPFTGYGVLTSGIVLAVMIIPTISALSREALYAVPQSQREAALAVGATRWETTRTAVLKYARSGLLGAVVLGLGRAIGETMAVVMTIGAVDTAPVCLTCNTESMAGLIASEFLDPANPYLDRSSLIEMGLVLLLITLVINLLARVLIWRVTAASVSTRESGSGLSRLRKRLGLKERASRDLEHVRTSGSETPAQVSAQGAGAGPRWGAKDALRRWMSRSMNTLALVCVAIAIIPLGDILWVCLQQGGSVISWHFLISPEYPASCSLSFAGCQVGGIGPALQGTLIMMGVATLWAAPVGILGAIFLSEYGRGPLGRSMSFLIDVMSGVPSIVVGVFVWTVYYLYFPGYVASLGAEAFALGIIMLPIIVRASEEALKGIPHTLREAAWGLGIPQRKTVTRVVLRSGIGPVVTGALLAIARVGGETAPLLFLGGYTRLSIFTNCPLFGKGSCFNNSAGGLGPLIFNYATAPGQNNHLAAWGAALVFLLMMLAISLGARIALRGRQMPAVLG